MVDDLTAGRDVRDRLELLFQFMGLLRTRVPAARDPIEIFLAHMARRTAKWLERDGELPPPPPGLENTVDEMTISIDPHQSILAMPHLMRGFGNPLRYVGFEVVHNTSSVLFITSDNPVIVLDPDIPETIMLPYTVRPPRTRVELLLPISPKVLLRGRSEVPMAGVGMPLRHVDMAAAADVRRVNRLAARFGYRFVFASHAGLEKLVGKYGAQSPTVRLDTVSDGDSGEFNEMQMVFGPRPQKPRWSA